MANDDAALILRLEEQKTEELTGNAAVECAELIQEAADAIESLLDRIDALRECVKAADAMLQPTGNLDCPYDAARAAIKGEL